MATLITNDTLANLDTMRLPELWALHVELFGEPTRNPNKPSLVRKLTEAIEARLAAGETAKDAPVTEANDTADAPLAQDAQADEGEEPVRLTKLSVDELRARYREVLGRDTSSVSKAYLIWKLREAAKGRIPLGPRTSTRGDGPAPDMMVLPLRMEREAVEAMDEAWKRLGLKSRTDLFRWALRAYFQGAGEAEVASRM